jgi:hypothetical protein
MLGTPTYGPIHISGGSPQPMTYGTMDRPSTKEREVYIKRGVSSRFISCVDTHVHMTCVHICRNVSYTNKNLDNERVTTFNGSYQGCQTTRVVVW